MTLAIGTPVRDRRRRGDEGKVIGFGPVHSKIVRIEWADGSQSWVFENRLETR